MAPRSPFPGMDPYLEHYWGDVHARLVSYACDQIQEKLKPGLIARMQEWVYIASPTLEPRAFSPDVHVTRSRRDASTGESGGVATASAVAEPELLRGLVITESFIEIRDAKSGELLITTIEFVSAANKRSSEGRRKYRQKQREVARSQTNFVEIDLLRGGRGVTLAASLLSVSERAVAYHASVRRGADPDAVEFYAFPLRQRLPSIRIPLRAGVDDDVLLDLQALIDQAYHKGRYGQTIDYAKPPRPPLEGDDADWAAGLVKQQKQ